VKYITPEQAVANGDKRSLDELRRLAKAPQSMCSVCNADTAWRFADTGMCFTCTTGEHDDSDDYEIRMPPLMKQQREKLAKKGGPP
jgi:hypothetical protein